MEGLLLKLMDELNSSVFVLLAIVVLAFYACYKVSFKLGSLKETFGHHSNRIDKVEGIADTIVEVKTMVNLVYQIVNPNIAVRSRSPASLTEVGESIAKKINADDIFKTHALSLIASVGLSNPQNAYDIQQASFVAVRKLIPELVSEAEMKAIKDEAYNHGIRAEDVIDIFAIMLRDKILTDKGIPVSDVDKHDETKT